RVRNHLPSPRPSSLGLLFSISSGKILATAINMGYNQLYLGKEPYQCPGSFAIGRAEIGFAALIAKSTVGSVSALGVCSQQRNFGESCFRLRAAGGSIR